MKKILRAACGILGATCVGLGVGLFTIGVIL